MINQDQGAPAAGAGNFHAAGAADDKRSVVERVADQQGPQPEDLSTRRRVLRWVIRISFGAFSLALLLPALAVRSLTRQIKTVAAGDTLVYATGSGAGKPVDPATIQQGLAIQAFPEGKSDNEKNLIELVRLGSDQGDRLVAYSAICTHLGCSVLPKLTDQGYILCPCHVSIYDPAEDAKVISGPAPRPLPSLPVEATPDNLVKATGEFSGPIGPQ